MKVSSSVESTDEVTCTEKGRRMCNEELSCLGKRMCNRKIKRGVCTVQSPLKVVTTVESESIAIDEVRKKSCAVRFETAV